MRRLPCSARASVKRMATSVTCVPAVACGVPTLLFVCTGNLCRSPMAAALARNVLAGRAEAVHVMSAGLLHVGEPATAEVVHLMKRRGLDLSTHRSRRVG